MTSVDQQILIHLHWCKLHCRIYYCCSILIKANKILAEQNPNTGWLCQGKPKGSKFSIIPLMTLFSSVYISDGWEERWPISGLAHCYKCYIAILLCLYISTCCLCNLLFAEFLRLIASHKYYLHIQRLGNLGPCDLVWPHSSSNLHKPTTQPTHTSSSDIKLNMIKLFPPPPVFPSQHHRHSPSIRYSCEYYVVKL